MCQSNPCAEARLTARRRTVCQHRWAGATGDGVAGKQGEAKTCRPHTAQAGSLSSTSLADFINANVNARIFKHLDIKCTQITTIQRGFFFFFLQIPRKRANAQKGKPKQTVQIQHQKHAGNSVLSAVPDQHHGQHPPAQTRFSSACTHWYTHFIYSLLLLCTELIKGQ